MGAAAQIAKRSMRRIESGPLRNPAFSIPVKEFDFADAEVARMKVAIEIWNHYGATADRRWLEPLVNELLSAEPR